jgi:hypothetical protein
LTSLKSLEIVGLGRLLEKQQAEGLERVHQAHRV